MKNPVIVALDLDDLKVASKLISQLQPHVGGFKIGPRLTLKADKSFMRDLSDAGIFFLDHKFFDIPSTTTASVQAAADLGADWVTVHALNGPECLKSLAQLETDLRGQNPDFRILVVTVLTSFDRATLPPIWRDEPIAESVVALADSADGAGLHSFVCSSEEVSTLRKGYPDSFLVVPGIRPEGSRSEDQKRVATPAAALSQGASALVIGRPIVAEKDPAAAAKRIIESLP